MRITSARIRNFRALENIEVQFCPGVNVVVGPNAIGKTTLLEAIRFAKALLAPRTQSESNQVLLGLGLVTPQNMQTFDLRAIGDPKKQILVSCSYELSVAEVELLKSPESLFTISSQVMFANMGRQFTSTPDLVASLSSASNQQMLEGIQHQLSSALAEVREGRREVKLEVIIEPPAGRIRSGDPLGSALIAYLDRRLPPSTTVFSYFPADRAIPSQDPAVQIGAADASQQNEAHNSQPQLKYQRLKSTIFNAVISGKGEAEKIEAEFSRIFSSVLRGRRLLQIGTSEQGLLKIQIEDEETGSQFAIDAMSSGEKGLILTFLLLARTLAFGGIVLLDEPELHLNPAVCKDVLRLLLEYSKERELQMIVCSHSPEILEGAFDREDAVLYHLVSGTVLTPVRRQDLEEVEEALQLLGTSSTEGLLYKATVFVEGDHDGAILEAGFDTLFRRYRFRDLGGRGNVEQEIRSLQAAEAKSSNVTRQYFIFDRDEAPTNLKSSKSVRILQWPRRCLENHLLDINVLTDVLKDEALVAQPVRNVGELQRRLKDLAKGQLDDLAIYQVYSGYNFQNTGLRSKEVQGKSFPDAATILSARIESTREEIRDLDLSAWSAQFVQDCERKRRELDESWEATWQENCDGKRLFRDLQRALEIKESILKFKERLIREMRNAQSENWRAMESLLKELMQ